VKLWPLYLLILNVLCLDQELSEQNDDDTVKDFPELEVKVGVLWQEEEGKLLTFCTPELKFFREVGKKSMYHVCVKVMRVHPPKRSWRTLYKIPTDKRTGNWSGGLYMMEY